MEQFFLEHPFAMAVILLFIGGFFSIIFKKLWEEKLAKSSRVTPEGCALAQKIYGEKTFAEIQEFRISINKLLGIQDGKFESGEDSITAIRVKVIRLNSLVETSIALQLDYCKTLPQMNCDNYIKKLINLGLEFDSADEKGKG